MSRAPIAAFCAALALAAAAVPTAAATEQDTYTTAVARAYTLVEQAREGNPPAARRATAELRAGTGESQPEILADLGQDPPNLDDAAARLRALSATLAAPAETPDPAGAHARLDGIIAESRYDAMRAGPNPLDRLTNWLVDVLARLLA